MLQQQIKDDMKTAMKAKESTKVMTLRGVMSAMTNELVSQKKTPQDELSDDDVLAVIKRESKKRKDSIEQFEGADRPELAVSEKEELVILEAYLPELMSQEEIEPIVQEVMSKTGISDKSKMGQLMGAVMAELGNKADGTDVKVVVEKLLS
jgi:uncharacterized protein YqeY